MSFTQRSGKIRLYDGTATPVYLEIDFDAGDFSGPLGVPMADEIIKLDRGKATEDMHHVKGSEAKVWEPSQISFGALATHLAQSGYLLDFLEWLNGGTETVNSVAVVTTKGDTMRDGVNTCPAFADTNKRACNLEIFWDEAGVDFGLQYNEVFFPIDQCNVSEGEDAVSLALSGLVYGSIARITAFTTGVDVEA